MTSSPGSSRLPPCFPRKRARTGWRMARCPNIGMGWDKPGDGQLEAPRILPPLMRHIVNVLDNKTMSWRDIAPPG